MRTFRSISFLRTSGSMSRKMPSPSAMKNSPPETVAGWKHTNAPAVAAKVRLRRFHDAHERSVVQGVRHDVAPLDASVAVPAGGTAGVVVASCGQREPLVTKHVVVVASCAAGASRALVFVVSG